MNALYKIATITVDGNHTGTNLVTEIVPTFGQSYVVVSDILL